MGRFTNGEDDVVDIIDQAPQVRLKEDPKGLLIASLVQVRLSIWVKYPEQAKPLVYRYVFKYISIL
jgi:hypothetical protein